MFSYDTEADVLNEQKEVKNKSHLLVKLKAQYISRSKGGTPDVSSTTEKGQALLKDFLNDLHYWMLDESKVKTSTSKSGPHYYREVEQTGVYCLPNFDTTGYEVSELKSRQPKLEEGEEDFDERITSRIYVQFIKPTTDAELDLIKNKKHLCNNSTSVTVFQTIVQEIKEKNQAKNVYDWKVEEDDQLKDPDDKDESEDED